MNTDTIADCFTRLRNGSKARQQTVSMPYSKMKDSVLKLLQREGYLADIKSEDRKLVVQLRYEDSGRPVLEHIRRVSKPGQRIYSQTPRGLGVRQGLGFQILSTSKGIMTDKEAIEKKVGGEVVGEVW